MPNAVFTDYSHCTWDGTAFTIDWTSPDTLRFYAPQLICDALRQSLVERINASHYPLFSGTWVERDLLDYRHIHMAQTAFQSSPPTSVHGKSYQKIMEHTIEEVLPRYINQTVHVGGDIDQELIADITYWTMSDAFAHLGYSGWLTNAVPTTEWAYQVYELLNLMRYRSDPLIIQTPVPPVHQGSYTRGGAGPDWATASAAFLADTPIPTGWFYMYHYSKCYSGNYAILRKYSWWNCAAAYQCAFTWRRYVGFTRYDAGIIGETYHYNNLFMPCPENGYCFLDEETTPVTSYAFSDAFNDANAIEVIEPPADGHYGYYTTGGVTMLDFHVPGGFTFQP